MRMFCLQASERDKKEYTRDGTKDLFFFSRCILKDTVTEKKERTLLTPVIATDRAGQG